MSEDFLKRVPPQNIEAEQSVVGAVLLDNDAIHDAVTIIKPIHFYREAHRLIYDHMLTLSLRNSAIALPSQTGRVSGRLHRSRGHRKRPQGATVPHGHRQDGKARRKANVAR